MSEPDGLRNAVPIRAASERLDARVRGHVQGVGFRWFVNRHANRLGLPGWVANESDGSVHVVAEGKADRLAELVELLHAGPSGSVVEGVAVSRAPIRERAFTRFEIRSRAHRGD